MLGDALPSKLPDARGLKNNGLNSNGYGVRVMFMVSKATFVSICSATRCQIGFHMRVG
jgi:hypothetical protein